MIDVDFAVASEVAGNLRKHFLAMPPGKRAKIASMLPTVDVGQYRGREVLTSDPLHIFDYLWEVIGEGGVAEAKFEMECGHLESADEDIRRLAEELEQAERTIDELRETIEELEAE